jgi:CYTH domain-containing protein
MVDGFPTVPPRTHHGGMASEIERKFLAASMPDEQELAPGRRLRQGYLAEEGVVEVRLRWTGDATTLTVKAGSGLHRTEVDVPIDPGEAEALWPHTDGRRLEKVRHEVALADGVVAELDRYEGDLEGLVTVEVEFPSEAEAARFDPPDWFGRELTGEPGWSNAALARHGRPT